MQVNFKEFSEVEQQAFTAAFYGYCTKHHSLPYGFDFQSPAPWGCPWYYDNGPTELKGNTPDEWGVAWAQENAEEILELLALEKESNDEEEC